MWVAFLLKGSLFRSIDKERERVKGRGESCIMDTVFLLLLGISGMVCGDVMIILALK